MASTPLPPDDGENNHASELPTGLRLSDVEQLAEQRLDGAADGLSGVPNPLPPNDCENDHAVELPANLRLSDAERIASERLDGAAEGSLKEALAIVPPTAPSSAALPLADRLEAVGEDLAAEAQAAPSLDATPAAEGSAQPNHETEPEPSPPAPVEDAAAALHVEGVAVPGDIVTWAARDGEVAANPTEDNPAAAGVALDAFAVAPSMTAEGAERVQPLASALDAAAKLAADANAAAEALENLKRLLERQLPNVAAGPEPSPPPADAEMRPPAPAAPASPPPLPSLPLRAAGDADAPQQPAPQLPMPMSPRHMPEERRRLDVRGFLAGFALSWAFGLVLYLFMSAG
jgi:hypothetical protein